MRVVYLANVGTRDVQRNGRPLPLPRTDGAALLAEFDNVRHELSAPILAAGLRKVLALIERIDRVLLFVSDQPSPPATKEEHWSRDTLEFGKLLERLLRMEFGERVQNVECEPMRLNPADYNRTLPFFAERLNLLVPPHSADVVYVAPVGGADASNVGLTINAVRCYRDRCQFIYVMHPGEVHLLNLHQELLGDYARREAAAHLARHDYPALRDTLRRAGLGKEWHRHLCDYADRRMRFDFRRADSALESAIAVADHGEAKVRIHRLRESIQPFLQERIAPTSTSPEGHWADWFQLQRKLLGELFFNLKLKAEAGDWVDCLGRLFRMHEAMLRLVFELETRHSTDGNDRQGYADFARAIARTADFALPAIDRPQPNLFVLGDKILQHWVKKAGKGQQYGEVERFRALIDMLSNLRNKSIIAHGYQAISREEIVEALKGKSPEELMNHLAAVLQRLGADCSEASNPYARTREMLQEMLGDA